MKKQHLRRLPGVITVTATCNLYRCRAQHVDSDEGHFSFVWPGVSPDTYAYIRSPGCPGVSVPRVLEIRAAKASSPSLRARLPK